MAAAASEEPLGNGVTPIISMQPAPVVPVIDPTVNVKDALNAAIDRFDALRSGDQAALEALRKADIGTMVALHEASIHLLDVEMKRVKELMEMRATYFDTEIKRLRELLDTRALYQEKLETAEAKRIDAIRAVDVGAVAIANQRATDQAAVLANQVAASAETLRILVSQTATAAKQQLDQTTSQLSDRIAAVERFQYEGKGSIGSLPPAVAEQLRQLEESRYRSEGKSGLSTPLMIAIAVAVTGLLSFILQRLLMGGL